MDGLPLFAMAVGALVLGAVAFVPLILPWPQRVRWTVLAQAMSHAGYGLPVCPTLDLREVELVSVDGHGSAITLGVLEVGHPPCDTLTLVGTTPPTAELVAMLREWCALRTPMLLFIDTDGVASLDGPVAAVTNLRRVEPRVARKLDA